MTRYHRSARLIYRAIEPEDEDFILEQEQDPTLMQQGSWHLPAPQNRKSGRETIKFMTEECVLSAIICLKPADESISAAELTPVGYVHLDRTPTNLPQHRSGDIGLAITPAHQGKGYGSEAIAWILDFAFNEANFHRVGCPVFSWNTRAWELYRRLGFTEDGRYRELLWMKGRWCDFVLMSMLDREWEALKNQKLAIPER